MKNLIDDPAFRKIRDDLDKRVDELAKEAKDPLKTDIIMALREKRKKSAAPQEKRKRK